MPSSPGYYAFNFTVADQPDSNAHALVESLPACNTFGIAVDADAQLLLDFRASFANGEAVLPFWNADTDPCGWEAVKCDSAGSITKMCVNVWPGRGVCMGALASAQDLLALPPAPRAPCAQRPSPSAHILAPHLCADTCMTGAWRALSPPQTAGSCPMAWRCGLLARCCPHAPPCFVLINCASTPVLLDLSHQENPALLVPPPWLESTQVTTLRLLALQSLQLASNNIYGTIPSGWRLPDSVQLLELVSVWIGGVHMAERADRAS